jgi:hypothetical protein
MKFTSLLACFLVFASQAFPFSGRGHQTVAAVASPLLTPATQAAIHEILGTRDIKVLLMEAATWPDDIKSTGSLSRSAAARKFNRDHPTNTQWHFVNFPAGSTRYTASSDFANSHDIVHMINQCIRTLEGEDMPERLSQKEALRFLVHLVGDIHQPFHVVAGYYDLTDPAHPKLLDPDEVDVANDPQDRGGLKLLVAPLGHMHRMWDALLVDDISPTMDATALAIEVMNNAPAPSSYKTSGKYTTWAAKWATDSMKIAKAAYAPDNMQFGAATVDDDSFDGIAVTLLPSVNGYRATHKEIIRVQLRKAGIHLAQLLNAIQWEEAP